VLVFGALLLISKKILKNSLQNRCFRVRIILVKNKIKRQVKKVL
jgi:hypothetical protein